MACQGQAQNLDIIHRHEPVDRPIRLPQIHPSSFPSNIRRELDPPGNNMIYKVSSLVLAATLSVLATAGVTSAPFGNFDGKSIDIYSLTNSKGMSARVMTWGATVVSLSTPDRKGAFDDVVCGFDKFEDYPSKSPYFGCIAGRYANRIAKGQFSLDKNTYHLAINNEPNSLHGGLKGFDKQIWIAKVVNKGAEPAVRFTYTSKDGEEGYPGTLTGNVTYTLTADNGLKIDYAVTTTKPTVANLTNHCYFNLAGKDARDNLDHVLTLNADKFTPVDKTLIPTGELRPVEGTPFDFRKPAAIGARIDLKDEQLDFGGGYDHNWVINGKAGTLREAASVYEPFTGRTMQVLTTEPGIQFYAGNFLDGTLTGKGGQIYQQRFAFCLETQRFPDSPNHPAFPTTVIRPGETYKSTTIYRFGSF